MRSTTPLRPSRPVIWLSPEPCGCYLAGQAQPVVASGVIRSIPSVLLAWAKTALSGLLKTATGAPHKQAGKAQPLLRQYVSKQQRSGSSVCFKVKSSETSCAPVCLAERGVVSDILTYISSALLAWASAALSNLPIHNGVQTPAFQKGERRASPLYLCLVHLTRHGL